MSDLKKQVSPGFYACRVYPKPAGDTPDDNKTGRTSRVRAPCAAKHEFYRAERDCKLSAPGRNHHASSVFYQA